MDDKFKDLLLSQYSKSFGTDDAIVNKALEKLKGMSLPHMQPQRPNVLDQAKDMLSGAVNYGGEAIANVGKILASSGPITQMFGNRNPIERFSGGVNYGTDIGVPTGTKVSLPKGRWQIVDANASGGMNQGYGNSIYAQNLETGEKLRLSHLSHVGVKRGDVVEGGQVIGETGATGNVTGPHLDLEYYDKSGRIADVMNSPYRSTI